MSDHTTLSVTLPTFLRERARSVARRLRTSTAQLIRDGLMDKVEAYEAKFRAEEAARVAAREAKKAGRAGTRAHPKPGLGQGGLRPLAPTERPTPPPARPSQLEQIYSDHAERILAAGDDPEAVRNLVSLTIQAVKHAAPLLHPSDQEIVAKLQAEVVRLRDSSLSSMRSYDAMVGKVIDTTKIKTYGDVDE